MKICKSCQTQFDSFHDICDKCMNKTQVIGQAFTNETTEIITANDRLLAEQAEENIGEVIGGMYMIQQLLSKDGISTVYAAKHIVTNQKVTIKELYCEQVDEKNCCYEQNILTAIEHPNIPKVIDHFYQQYSKYVYIVMDYIEGETLQQKLEQGTISTPQLVQYVVQLCELLKTMHQLTIPIFHLDIKPSNIVIHPNGQLYLIDFGSARQKHLAKDLDVATPGFAAPEQLKRGYELDERMDIYSIGALMYYVLSGGHYYTPESQKLNVDQALQAIVEKATAANPNDRFQTVQQLRNEMYELPKENKPQPQLDTISVKPVVVEERDKRRFKKFLWALAIIGIVSILVIIRVTQPETTALEDEADEAFYDDYDDELYDEDINFIYEKDLDDKVYESPQELLTDFYEAVESSDADKLAQVLVMEEEDTFDVRSLSAEEVQPLLKYFQDNGIADEIKANFNAQQEAIESGELIDETFTHEFMVEYYKSQLSEQQFIERVQEFESIEYVPFYAPTSFTIMDLDSTYKILIEEVSYLTLYVPSDQSIELLMDGVPIALEEAGELKDVYEVMYKVPGIYELSYSVDGSEPIFIVNLTVTAGGSWFDVEIP